MFMLEVRMKQPLKEAIWALKSQAEYEYQAFG